MQAPGQYRDLSVYVIDTGIYSKHNDFEDNQVQHGYTAQSIENEGTDVNTLSLGKTMKLCSNAQSPVVRRWLSNNRLLPLVGAEEIERKNIQRPFSKKKQELCKVLYLYGRGYQEKKNIQKISSAPQVINGHPLRLK